MSWRWREKGLRGVLGWWLRVGDFAHHGASLRERRANCPPYACFQFLNHAVIKLELRLRLAPAFNYHLLTENKL